MYTVHNATTDSQSFLHQSQCMCDTAVDTNPRASTCLIASASGVSRCSVQNVLNFESLLPFYLQQFLLPFLYDPPALLSLQQWFFQQSAQDVNLLAYVLFTDESIFIRGGICNQQNAPLCAVTPHDVAQYHFTLNVWAGIVGVCLVGPCILSDRLTTGKYLNFLKYVLQQFLDSSPANMRCNMWVKHGRVPSNYGMAVSVKKSFTHRSFGRCRPVPYSPRSPDLSSFDFFLWGILLIIYLTTFFRPI